MMDFSTLQIGLVDADLLNGGTRHPNLALLKIAGFLKDNGVSYRLITDTNEDVYQYNKIFISKVFSFTPDPLFYTKAIGTSLESKFSVGGTGYYAVEKNIAKFKKARINDMHSLEQDGFLNKFPNIRGNKRPYGIDMVAQMPDYDLYQEYVMSKIREGRKESYYNDYLHYSIGFLTRGCFRHCPFCVNKLENNVFPYSNLDSFLDNEKDDNGKLVRPYIYLWDDNFLAASPDIWRPLLQQLIDSKRPFQFRQGLDERIFAESEYGEEIAEKLSNSRYHGDFIFAFDNWRDRDKIVKALKIWKHYNTKGTKFYLFCGFRLTKDSDELLYQDIWEIFQRIKILMQYGCLGYIMRHEDYNKHPLNNIYVQIARWCNQPQFYKKMSFWEFCYRNQTYWEEKTFNINISKKLKSYNEFIEDYKAGYYKDKKICLPLKTILTFLEKFAENKEELLEMFNYRFSDLVDPLLWKR